MFVVIFISILQEGIWKNRKKLEPQKFRATRYSVLFIRIFCLLPFLMYNLLLRFIPALLASTRDSTNTPHFDHGLFMSQ